MVQDRLQSPLEGDSREGIDQYVPSLLTTTEHRLSHFDQF